MLVMVSYYNDEGNDDDNEPQIQNPKGEIWAVSGPILDMDGLVLDSQWPTPKRFSYPNNPLFCKASEQRQWLWDVSYTYTHTHKCY